MFPSNSSRSSLKKKGLRIKYFLWNLQPGIIIYKTEVSHLMSENSQATSECKIENSIWNEFNDCISTQPVTIAPGSNTKVELEKYLSEHIVGRNTHPLLW